MNIPVGTFGIGDVAIATVGAEMDTNIGTRIKDESPLAKTMLVTQGPRLTRQAGLRGRCAPPAA